MQINVEFDTREFKQYLKKIGSRREISKAVLKALHRTAMKFRKDLYQWTPQDSRQLLDSWEVQWKSDLSIEAGYNEVYAMYQEMGMRADGTHIIQNRPAGGKTHFFKETLEDGAKKYIEIFESELLKFLT